ncbi:hypothetical protein Tcan_15823 [Toxocara canis]|uniref:Uncharacterized protein n=1 Tax=Toxocara canis TaxID=6265 RepID=A0A0B2UZA9_TOXCA|nr:hypothetical protein Tcan_15823 [Toxocara canis]
MLQLCVAIVVHGKTRFFNRADLVLQLPLESIIYTIDEHKLRNYIDREFKTYYGKEQQKYRTKRQLTNGKRLHKIRSRFSVVKAN